MSLPTLVFDFDGTLADTMMAYGRAWNKVAEGTGLKQITPEEILTLRHQTPKEIMNYLGLSLLKLPWAANKMRGELSRRITELNDFPGIKEALTRLNRLGYSLGILTSNSRENVEAFLKNRKLELFDFIYSGSRIFGKGAILKFLLKKHGLSPKETIYICDEVRDIEAARKAGLKVIAVSWGFNSGELLARERPEALVHQPDELIPAVQNLSTDNHLGTQPQPG